MTSNTAWINCGGHYPDYSEAAELTVGSLTALADELFG
jgi:hypothetical protein